MKHIKKFNENWTAIKDFVGAPFFVPSHYKTEYEGRKKISEIVKICRNNEYNLKSQVLVRGGLGSFFSSKQDIEIWTHSLDTDIYFNKKISLIPDFKKGTLEITWNLKNTIGETISTLDLKNEDVTSLANQIMEIFDNPGNRTSSDEEILNN